MAPNIKFLIVRKLDSLAWHMLGLQLPEFVISMAFDYANEIFKEHSRFIYTNAQIYIYTNAHIIDYVYIRNLTKFPM